MGSPAGTASSTTAGAVAPQPFIAPDGRAITQSGYDTATGIYLDLPADLVGIRIPEHPADRDVITARALLDDRIARQFKWADEPSYAHAWAAILTPAVVPCSHKSANIPALVINKPVSGSGATYFCS